MGANLEVGSTSSSLRRGVVLTHSTQYFVLRDKNFLRELEGGWVPPPVRSTRMFLEDFRWRAWKWITIVRV